MCKVLFRFSVIAAALAVVGNARAQEAQYKLGIKFSVTLQGMRIDAVLPRSAASVAGLEVGDYIVTVNRNPIRNAEDYFTALQLSRGRAELMVRSAKTRQLKPVIVTLGEGSSSVVGKVPYQLGVQGLYTPTGMRIVKVTPGSPADKSGLKAGDFLVRIDDQPIVNQLALQKAVQTSGGEIQLLVRKSGGQTVQLKTKLAGGGDREAFQLGISYSIRPEGLRADTVLANSPAARAGLRRGDIILNINGQRIRTEKDYQTALENSAGYLELIVRSSEDGQSRRVLVDLVARGPFDR